MPPSGQLADVRPGSGTSRAVTVLADRLTGALTDLSTQRRVTAGDVDALVRTVRLALLEADVALAAVRELTGALTPRLRAELPGAARPAHRVADILTTELTAALGGTTTPLALPAGQPAVIVLAGLQGVGKTSLAGKLAAHLRTRGRSVLLAAADLARPGAVRQLEIVAGQAGAAAFTPEAGDGTGRPVDVARAARAAAAVGGHDVVIIDTAGRLGVDETLMAEAADIVAVTAADVVLLAVDALSGQDAARTAAAFTDALPVTGVVLTKCDADTRGGAALTVRHTLGVPVLFTAGGEKVTDLDVFHPDRYAARLLGLGDLRTLLEKAAPALEAAPVVGELTFDDFLAQLRALRRLGPLTRLAGLLPAHVGLSGLADVDERDVARVEALICAMTPAERADPALLDASRAARIAAGSGTAPEQVFALAEQVLAARETLRSVTGRAGRGGKKNAKKRARR